MKYMFDFGDYLKKIIKQCEYDSNGNLIHRAYLCGKEEWFDSNGNLTHSKDEFGLEHWCEYDMNGNLIHDKSNTGDEEWYENEYDPNSKLIHQKNNKGCETWYEYDSNGNPIHQKVTDDDINWEGWGKYDSKDNLIHQKVNIFYKEEHSADYEEWYEYDSRGNLIHEKSKTDSYKNNERYKTSNHERWLKYDSNGNLIHDKDSNGLEFFGKYNSDDQLIYVKCNAHHKKFYEELIEYNSNGKVIHVKESIKVHYYRWFNHEVEYDSDGNVIHEERYDTYARVLKKVSTANKINASYEKKIAEYYLAGVLIFAAIVFLAVFLIRKIPKHASSARQGDYGNLELSVDEKKNPVDLQSGVSYNTILTSDQIIEAYDKAKDYFFVHRDNEAQIEIRDNKVLLVGKYYTQL